MPDQNATPPGSSVPQVSPKPRQPAFFDSFERHYLGLDLYLLIAAIVGGGLLAFVMVIVKSIKW